MKHNASSRFLSGVLAITTAVPVIGCGRPEAPTAPTGPPNAPYGSVPPPANRQPQQQTGMSTRKKLALLAGAAALIYLYNRQKNAKGAGQQGKYYLSKNGRVYYRDAKGNAIWVTPPKQGIQVPQEEADFYERAAQSRNWNASYRPSASTMPFTQPMPRMPLPGRAPTGGPAGPPGPPR